MCPGSHPIYLGVWRIKSLCPGYTSGCGAGDLKVSKWPLRRIRGRPPSGISRVLGSDNDGWVLETIGYGYTLEFLSIPPVGHARSSDSGTVRRNEAALFRGRDQLPPPKVCDTRRPHSRGADGIHVNLLLGSQEGGRRMATDSESGQQASIWRTLIYTYRSGRGTASSYASSTTTSPALVLSTTSAPDKPSSAHYALVSPPASVVASRGQPYPGSLLPTTSTDGDHHHRCVTLRLGG